jgi:cell division septation protein DedD
VRVGGFTSRKEAETARERLAIQLGAPDLVVAEAP